MDYWCMDCYAFLNNDVKCHCGSTDIMLIENDNITLGEWKAITSVSHDKIFVQNMISIKEKDPIEFQLKLAQFKATTAQQESVKSHEQNIPKCPTCGSTNIKKISAGSRWLSTGLFGISSSKLGKSMECRHCGYKW